MQANCERMRKLARTEPAPSYEVRMERLEALEKMVLDNQERIVDAIDSDFGGEHGSRGRAYCTLGDIWSGLNTVREVKYHLHEWMAESRDMKLGFTRFPLNAMGKARIYSKPLGVILALTPWNYPLHIPVSALGDILGAGNRCVIKPSEHTPATSALLAELVAATFSPEVVTVYNGGPEVATALASFPFDHIIFVGSGAIGKKVLAAAAPNLTKVTLELGGKNPVLVCPDYDLKAAAECVATEKLENGGQICTGADTVFVPPGRAKDFLAHMGELYKSRWGAEPLDKHPQFVSMINKKHFERTQGLLDDAKKHGADIVSLDPTGCLAYTGNGYNIPPVAIINPSESMLVSTEELFSPLLVIREMELTDAVAYVNDRPEPLACYVFTNNEATKEEISLSVRCGGMTVNMINKHTIVGPLPFGGVGASGMGCYHGIEAFKNFTHQMSRYEYKPVGLVGFLWNRYGPNVSVPYSAEDVKTIQGFLAPLPWVRTKRRGQGVCCKRRQSARQAARPLLGNSSM